jgi:hypothetical protein
MKFRYWKFVVHLNCMGIIMMAISFNHPILANEPNVRTAAPNNATQQPETLFDGVEFKTFTPDNPVEIPKEGEFIRVKFGLRITNKSSSDKKFREALIVPNMLNKDNKPVFPSPDKCQIYGSAILAIDADEMYKTVKPGESVDFFQHTVLYKRKGSSHIRYDLSTGYKVACSSEEIKPGKHSIFITYQNESKRVVDSFSDKTIREQIWSKKIDSTPSAVDFVETSKFR